MTFFLLHGSSNVLLMLLTVSIQQQAIANDSDACTCLTWNELYSSARATCGEGLEGYMITNGGTSLTLKEIDAGWLYASDFMQDVCSNFFEQLPTNDCVKVAHTPPPRHNAEHLSPYAHIHTKLASETWCYVPNECTKLNGGHAVPDKEIKEWDVKEKKTINRILKRDISWKVCQPEMDPALLKKTPYELQDIAARMGHSLGHMVLQAYPKLFFNAGDINQLILDDIMPAWRVGDVSKMPEMVQDLIAQKEPFVLNTQRDGRGRDNQAVIIGTQLFNIDRDLDENGELKCPKEIYCLKPNNCQLGCDGKNEL